MAKFIIRFYQLLQNYKHTLLVSVFGFSYRCEHKPSCSEYVILESQKSGTITAVWKGFLRVITCW